MTDVGALAGVIPAGAGDAPGGPNTPAWDQAVANTGGGGAGATEAQTAEQMGVAMIGQLMMGMLKQQLDRNQEDQA